MGLIKINKEKCTACGICVKACPVRILSMGRDNDLPQPIGNAEELCIDCGHCVSICPEKALDLKTMDVNDLEELADGWKISLGRLEPFLKGRRSIRCFRDAAVEKEKLEKLIGIAGYAPTGLNRQPVRWLVVHDREKTHKIAEAVIGWMRGLVKEKDHLAESLHMDLSVNAWDKGDDRICRGAPHIVIGYALKENKMAVADSAIAFTYLDLAAVSMGLGSCWAGYVVMAINSSDEVRKLLGLSARSACFGAMMIGYPKFEYKRIPLRNKPSIKWK